ncbi:hypothetical protein Tco_0681564 [Tanacetum coccineum]|uniref:Uncharacterized protein n=1 Tax=Tanacetum coccineum TaxID=301880 RepID=A0ABQ4XQC3_9ASTR
MFTKSLLPTPKLMYNIFVRTTSSQVPNVNQSLNKPKPVYNNTPYRKQLTQKELDEKNAKNECFYSDQRYVSGHKCGGKLFSLEIVERNEDLGYDNELQADMGVFGSKDNVVESEGEEQNDG